MGFILRIVVYTLGLLVAAHVVPGIRLDGLASALVAGLLLGLVNAIVRPVLVVLTFPITLLTLGLFLLVLNAFCLWLVSVFVSGFRVAGFWPAFWGALLVSLVSWVLTALNSDRGRVEVIERRR
jgi:putative membrane protein